jgi:molybdate transport system substrate-binding protein
MIAIRRTAALALVAVLSFSTSVRAETVAVLSAGAVQSAMVDLIAAHSAAQGSGYTVTQEYMPVGPLMKKLTDGAKPDVIILSEEAMVGAVEKGFVDKDSVRVIGRVGIGVAIKTGATAPDIATPEALKATLLAAKSIVYIDPTRGTSGKHFAGVIEAFGITDALKAKTTLGSGGYVVEPVGRGEVELGIHQITEILPVKGVTLLGPLPARVQKITVYVAGIARTATNPSGAKSLITHATGEQAQRVLATKGFMVGK